MAAFLLAIGLSFVATNAQAAEKSYSGVSTSKPIKYDKKKKQVKILTTVNGTYFTQPTRHVIVATSGSNGDKSLLKTEVKPTTFYKDMKKIGAKGGDNLTKQSKAGSKIKGTSLKVYFVINGKKVRAEKATQVNGKDVKNYDFKFGGNLAMAKKMNTGCVLCFDSCPVGIASGAKYGFSYGEHFTGKSSVLPKDGSKMAVIIQAK